MHACCLAAGNDSTQLRSAQAQSCMSSDCILSSSARLAKAICQVNTLVASRVDDMMSSGQSQQIRMSLVIVLNHVHLRCCCRDQEDVESSVEESAFASLSPTVSSSDPPMSSDVSPCGDDGNEDDRDDQAGFPAESPERLDTNHGGRRQCAPSQGVISQGVIISWEGEYESSESDSVQVTSDYSEVTEGDQCVTHAALPTVHAQHSNCIVSSEGQA
jgi:hypothetical protein